MSIFLRLMSEGILTIGMTGTYIGTFRWRDKENIKSLVTCRGKVRKSCHLRGWCCQWSSWSLKNWSSPGLILKAVDNVSVAPNVIFMFACVRACVSERGGTGRGSYAPVGVSIHFFFPPASHLKGKDEHRLFQHNHIAHQDSSQMASYYRCCWGRRQFYTKTRLEPTHQSKWRDWCKAKRSTERRRQRWRGDAQSSIYAAILSVFRLVCDELILSILSRF